MSRSSAAIKIIALWWCFGSATVPAQTAAPDRNLVVVQTAPTAAVPSASRQRVALVIGNSNYKEAPLANPSNDARAVAQALKESGFTVIERVDVDQKGFLAALREFGDRLRGGGVGLFYYAGHGMQIKGRNFLIPVGAPIEREDEVAYHAVDAQAVLDKMEAAGNASNIMILDACRNNPFVRSMRSGQAGLAQMDAPVGTLVAFSTAPGSVASDGSGSNGLYTQHLLTAMRQQGAKVEDVFKQVRANVRRDSSGAQVPWEVTSLEGDFYFKALQAPAPGGPPAAASVQAALDQALWDVVKTSSQPLELRAYLSRFPQGQFAAQAQTRLRQLEPGGATPASPAAPTTPAAMPAQVAAAAPAAPPLRRPPARNVNGFTVGDRWRFQIVDKWKAEVVSNFSHVVTQIAPSGEVIVNKGGQRWDATGQLHWQRTGGGSVNEFSPYVYRWALDMKPGEKRDVSWKRSTRREDGSSYAGEDSGSLEYRGMERVRTPAGDFDAQRFEQRGFFDYKANLGNRIAGSFRNTYWYVPALRYYVAADYETTDSQGKLQRRDREELTSYEVASAGLQK